MPRGDRTGPWGQGPKTGRGAGFCSGNSVPGFMNRFGGWFGRGWRWFSSNTQPRQNVTNRSVDDITGQLRSLREQLNSIEKKIKGIRDS